MRLASLLLVLGLFAPCPRAAEKPVEAIAPVPGGTAAGSPSKTSTDSGEVPTSEAPSAKPGTREAEPQGQVIRHEMLSETDWDARGKRLANASPGVMHAGAKAGNPPRTQTKVDGKFVSGWRHSAGADSKNVWIVRRDNKKYPLIRIEEGFAAGTGDPQPPMRPPRKIRMGPRPKGMRKWSRTISW